MMIFFFLLWGAIVAKAWVVEEDKGLLVLLALACKRSRLLAMLGDTLCLRAPFSQGAIL